MQEPPRKVLLRNIFLKEKWLITQKKKKNQIRGWREKKKSGVWFDPTSQDPTRYEERESARRVGRKIKRRRYGDRERKRARWEREGEKGRYQEKRGGGRGWHGEEGEEETSLFLFLFLSLQIWGFSLVYFSFSLIFVFTLFLV